MSRTTTHLLAGRGFGSKEMAFGELAIERSLNALSGFGHTGSFSYKGKEGLTHEQTQALHATLIAPLQSYFAFVFAYRSLLSRQGLT